MRSITRSIRNFDINLVLYTASSVVHGLWAPVHCFHHRGDVRSLFCVKMLRPSLCFSHTPLKTDLTITATFTVSPDLIVNSNFFVLGECVEHTAKKNTLY